MFPLAPGFPGASSAKQKNSWLKHSLRPAGKGNTGILFTDITSAAAAAAHSGNSTHGASLDRIALSNAGIRAVFDEREVVGRRLRRRNPVAAAAASAAPVSSGIVAETALNILSAWSPTSACSSHPELRDK